MANLARVRVGWSGSPVVGPGVSTFYFNEAASGWTAALDAFFEAIKLLIPVGTNLTIPNSGDLIDIATGELSGTWSEAGGGGKAMTGTGGFAMGVGARVRWNTAGVRSGRRVRGTTYLVPIVINQYDAANGLQTSFVTNVSNAAQTFLTAMGSDFVIYSKPKPGLVGQAHPVTSREVPDAVSWLRSRRT